MNRNILHVGLDVDDTQYHGSAFNKQTGEVIDFKCRPTLKGLLTQLDKLQRHCRGLSIRLCYEASYVGFCLQRDLRAHRVHCDVVAPSSIPAPQRLALQSSDRLQEPLDQTPLCLAVTHHQGLFGQPAGKPEPTAAPDQGTGPSAGGVWPAHRGTGGHAALPGGRAVADLLQRHQEYLRSDHDHRDR